MISGGLLALALAASPSSAPPPPPVPAPVPAPPAAAPAAATATDGGGSTRDPAVGLLSSLVTASLARHRGVDVIASADVRKQLELESNKQALGCPAESTSCLAELAGAMGTRFVVTGTVGRLGRELVLTLNLFDSGTGTAPGRVAVRATSVEQLSKKVDGACSDLLGALSLDSPARAERIKLLVLDLDGAIGSDAPPPPAPTRSAAPLITLVTGASVAAAGGGLLVVSGLADNAANEKKATQVDAANAYTLRDITGWAGLIGVGAGVVVAGVGAVLFVGGE